MSAAVGSYGLPLPSLLDRLPPPEERPDMRSKEGRRLKPLVIRAAGLLRAEGHTVVAIAEALGISPMTASMYAWEAGIVGHYSEVKDRIPHDPTRAKEDHAALLAEEEARHARRVEFARVQFREAQRDGRRPWWHFHREEPVRPAEAQEELVALAAEQSKQLDRDGHWNGEWRAGSQSVYPNPRMPSFDAPAGPWKGVTDAPNGWPSRHDQLHAPQRDEPLGALEEADRAERLAAIVGDIDLEDVGRMDEATLDHLRSRLREEGLVSISVQRSERERLRLPDRHRGRAPAAMRGKKSSSHRGRNEQQALMAGKRTSRKQRKRWAREAGEW